MQIGTTKDQDLYNKPPAAVCPGALAVGTLPQYNTIPLRTQGLQVLNFQVATIFYRPGQVIAMAAFNRSYELLIMIVY